MFKYIIYLYFIQTAHRSGGHLMAVASTYHVTTSVGEFLEKRQEAYYRFGTTPVHKSNIQLNTPCGNTSLREPASALPWQFVGLTASALLYSPEDESSKDQRSCTAGVQSLSLIHI